MKNLLKKFAVITASLMLAMTTFAVPSFAAGAAMTINGVTNEEGVFDKDATVVGYQVVKQNQTTQEWEMTGTFGEKREVEVDGKKVEKWFIKGTDIEFKLGDANYKPDATALAALAKLATGSTITFTANESAKSFVNTDETKGSWLVLVTPSQAGTIYNPMIVSRDYKTGGTVDATANAKKSNIPFEKVVDRRAPHNTGTNADNDNVLGDSIDKTPTGDDISAVNCDPAAGVDGNKGDTAGSTGNTITYNKETGEIEGGNGNATVYDDVWFRINTKVPAYAENYFKSEKDDDGNVTYPATVGTFINPKFTVKDTLSKGLTMNTGKADNDNLRMSVKVGDQTFYDNNDYLTITRSATGFTVAFTPLGVKEFGGKNVEICYSAKLNLQHGVNFDGEKNTAELSYTRAPGEDQEKVEERETYHYTFTINGNVDAKAKKENREVIKIGLDESDNWVMKETVAVEEEDWHPLAGVKFELKDGKGDDANVIKNVVTDADGILRGMDQIDAGVYYLYETSLGDVEANKKYSVKDIPIKVEIKAELDEKGRLINYQVIVGQDGGEQILVGNYEKVYEGNDKGTYFLDKSNKRIAKLNDNGVVTDIGNCARHVSEEYNFEDTDTEAADIVNTPLGTLPSTGGMGTILFTIGGIVLIGLAFLLLFGGRRRQHQK